MHIHTHQVLSKISKTSDYSQQSTYLFKFGHYLPQRNHITYIYCVQRLIHFWKTP